MDRRFKCGFGEGGSQGCRRGVRSLGRGDLRGQGVENTLRVPPGGEDAGMNMEGWAVWFGDPDSRASREVSKHGMVVAKVVVVGLKGLQMPAEQVAGDHSQGVHQGLHPQIVSNISPFDERGQPAELRGHGLDSFAQRDQPLFDFIGFGFLRLKAVNVPRQALVPFTHLPAQNDKIGTLQRGVERLLQLQHLPHGLFQTAFAVPEGDQQPSKLDAQFAGLLLEGQTEPVGRLPFAGPQPPGSTGRKGRPDSW